MKILLRAALGATLLVGLAVPGFAGPLKLEFKNGLVTLDARDVPPAQILAEWARVGQTKIINGEKVTGGPVTLQFNGVPEKQALDVVLRAAAGYMAAPRPAVQANTSLYDRIVVLAASRPAPSTPAVAGGAVPMQPRPRMPEPGTTDDQDNGAGGRFATPLLPGQVAPNQPIPPIMPGQQMYGQPGMAGQPPFGMQPTPNPQQGPAGTPVMPYTSPTMPGQPGPGQNAPQPGVVPGTSPVPGIVPQKPPTPPKGPGGEPPGL